ncbi:MAG: hypothetical protein KY469_15845 [Actinobacteria bacterium]|nr:hypothetical protein [Actinomycetota bacterium]
MRRPRSMSGTELMPPLLAAVSSRVQVAVDRRRAVAYLADTARARAAAPRLIAGLAAACRQLERQPPAATPVDREPVAALVDGARLAASAWTATTAPPRQRHAHDLLGEALRRAVEAATELGRATGLDGRKAWFGAVVASELACTAERRWQAGLQALAGSLAEVGLELPATPRHQPPGVAGPVVAGHAPSNVLPFRRPTPRPARSRRA